MFKEQAHDSYSIWLTSRFEIDACGIPMANNFDQMVFEDRFIFLANEMFV